MQLNTSDRFVARREEHLAKAHKLKKKKRVRFEQNVWETLERERGEGGVRAKRI